MCTGNRGEVSFGCGSRTVCGGLRTAIPLLLIFFSFPLQAQESGCSRAAEEWIVALGGSNTQLLRRHTRSNCQFSGKWVEEHAQVANRDRRVRMCTDLVLIWTHKKCVYFRDYVDPDVYRPCKAWSREMFRHCMLDDVAWFP